MPPHFLAPDGSRPWRDHFERGSTRFRGRMRAHLAGRNLRSSAPSHAPMLLRHDQSRSTDLIRVMMMRCRCAMFADDRHRSGLSETVLVTKTGTSV
jgi:hypothetical protein